MLIDNGPCVVQVQRRKRSRDKYGENGDFANDGEPVSVRCMMQIASATEVESLGLQENTVYTAITRYWPGNINCIVTWGDYVFEQVGDTRHYRNGKATQHDDAVLRRING